MPRINDDLGAALADLKNAHTAVCDHASSATHRLVRDWLDAILRSSGWQDATPQEPGSGAEMAQGMPTELDKDVSAQQIASETQPGSPHVGQRAGIETMAVGA